MITYISMLLATIILGYFAIRNKKNKRKYCIFSILSSVPFIIVSAIRYDVGSDFIDRYSQAFTHIAKGGYVSTYEYGFYLLNKICCLITHNPQIIFIITSIAINGSIFYLIFKYSKNPLLSIVIYFIGAYYFESMNIIRQYLGVSILLFAFPLIKEKKYIKVLILCTIAYFIHNASIVLSLTYILLFIYNKIYPKSYIIKKCDNAYLVLIGILIIIILHKYIYYGITFALSIASDKYFAYVGSKYDYSDLQITPLISGIIIYIYIYFAKRRMLEGNTKESEKYYDDYFIIIQTIDLIFIAMTSINILFLRISYMFGIFQIFSIPYYYEKYYKYHKRNILIYITLFIMFTSFIWINIVNKVEEALPYQTVFNIKSDGEKNE